MLENQFDFIKSNCVSLFSDKLKDYGPTWLLYRQTSLLDQLWIKIRRIRVLEENGGNALINESKEDEFIGIINYSAIMLMLYTSPEHFPSGDEILEDVVQLEKVDREKAISLFTKMLDDARDLMIKKNHDYGDAWKSMHTDSITDMIIIKLTRIKNIIKNDGKLLVSEDISAQLFDVINYAVFALIRLGYC